MAFFRKLFCRKPPDGLVEMAEHVYVFDCCFSTDAWEEENYKVYLGGIVQQLREQVSDAQLLVFNFREEETRSPITDVLSEYDITILDYPRHYGGCPLLTMEMVHHFLRSTESWLSLGQHNLLLMHCERGGWPVLAFMLAAFLIYRKQCSGEQKTLDMIYRQAPRDLLQLLSPLNPVPSQLRYLQYVSRRNVVSEWPPLDRALTLDCIILRFIPNFDGEGGCCPVFRIYGQDPFLVNDRSTKLLCSTAKRSKAVRAYKQAECELVKIDINCHIQGDVLIECINLNDDMKQEEMMFRFVFNTAFIRSNILMLNLDEVDILWDAKELFPKKFRAEVLFSDMDAAASVVNFDVTCFQEEGLPVEAFAKAHEIFSHVDWLDHRVDFAFNMLQHLSASNNIQDNSDSDSGPSAGTSPVLKKAYPTDPQDRKELSFLDDSPQSSILLASKILSVPSSKVSPDNNENKEERCQVSQNALQLPSQSDVMSQQTRKSSQSASLICTFVQESPLQVFGHHDTSQAGGKCLVHYHKSFVRAEASYQMTTSSADSVLASASAQAVPRKPQSVDVESASISPPTPPLPLPPRPSLTSNALKATSPPPPPPPVLGHHHLSASNLVHSSPTKESESHLGDKVSGDSPLAAPEASISVTTSNASFSTAPSPIVPKIASTLPTPPPPPPPPPTPPLKTPVSVRTMNASFSTPLPASPVASLATPSPQPPPPPPPPPTPPLKETSSNRAGPPPPPPPPVTPGESATTVSSPVPPLPPPPIVSSNSAPVPSAPPPPKGNSKTGAPIAPPSNGKSRLSRTLSPRNHQTKKLKPLHWLKFSRAVQGSLWAEAQKPGEASKAPEIDMSELESLFSVTVSNSAKKLGLRSPHGPKSDKVQLIDHRRAYNCEIMLSKVKVPLHDLMSSVLALEESAIAFDQVENLIKFCPTKEEMELLKGYTGEKEKLGRCEQFFVELMKVPQVESKLRVFSFKIQFHTQVSDLRNSLNVVNSAAEQIRGSAKLRRIMQTVLSLGNALNQGTARGSAIGFRLDSLLKLSDTRARNNKMTLMHYLCKVLADKLPEVLDFSKELSSLEPASKIQLKILAEEMQAISKGLEIVVQELSTSENDGPVSEKFCKALKEFLHFAEAEARTLASLYSGVGRNVDALILYFGEDPARCTFEEVVSTLLNFMRMFNKAHDENCKHLEQEMKKSAENEKSKMNVLHKKSEGLLHTSV